MATWQPSLFHFDASIPVISYHNASSLFLSCHIFLYLIIFIISYRILVYLIIPFHIVSCYLGSSYLSPEVSRHLTCNASKARILISFLKRQFYSFDLGKWQWILQFLCRDTFNYVYPKPKTRLVHCTCQKISFCVYVYIVSYNTHVRTHTHTNTHTHILHSMYMASIHIHLMQASPTYACLCKHVFIYNIYIIIYIYNIRMYFLT